MHNSSRFIFDGIMNFCVEVYQNIITKYKIEDVQNAIQEVKEGKTKYEVSKKYSIPYQTLDDKLKRKHSNQIGQTTTLNQLEENLLADWIVECSAMGMPQTKQQILRAATDISLRKRRSKKFKHNKPSARDF